MFFMALGDGPAYGYELSGRFRKMTRGHIRFSYGTIYPMLRRMERRGDIKSRRDRKTGRVYYELTQRGIEAKKGLMKRIREYRKGWEDKLLGILAMHAEVFGQESLNDLLKRARTRK
jgi:DNA-binding PadR family transcriptional regulator